MPKTPLPAWSRPHWQPSGEDILLQFYVFGTFSEGRPPMADYGSDGLPEGIALSSHRQADLRTWEGYPLKGGLGRTFRENAPNAYRLALSAPQVLVIHGRLPDSPDTGYLRDTLGVLAALLDVGGIAILDPQILTLFDAASWRQQYLLPAGAPIRHHLLILRDADAQAAGRYWIHTRGMRKFGRPDISIRNVPEAACEHAGILCQRLAELEALGAHFIEGQPLDVEGLNITLTAHMDGAPDHPDFSNTFVEFHWPT